VRKAAVSLLVLFSLGCCSVTQDNAIAAPDLSKLAKDASNPFPSRTQSWELGENHDPKFILVDNTYYMFYAGAAVSGTPPMRIGVQSTTASAYPYGWAKYDNNPVLSHNSQTFDATLISSPIPIRMQDNTYRLYYHGLNSGTGLNLLAFATTTAAEFPGGWTKYAGNPIFTVGAPSAWDDYDLRPSGAIIPAWESPDNTWHLLYGGIDGAAGNWKTGHATSVDGITWTRDAANPILSPGAGPAWDNHDALALGWFKVGDTYYFPYGGSNNAKWEIGYCTTTDFVTFTKGAGNPILTVGGVGQWDKTTIENPGSVYHASTDTVDLWYVGTDSAFVVNGSTNYRIGLARFQNLTSGIFGGTLNGGTLR
jgi:hypothetical protein